MKGVFSTTAAYTMSSLLSDVSSIVTAAISWIGDFLQVITSNPLLLAFIVVGFVGIGIGLLRRLMHV